MRFLYRRDGSLRGPKTERGFTLLEIFITMAVLAIMVSLAMPLFRDVIRNANVSGETNDLVTALSTARAEAVRRGTRVAVIANSGATATEWTTGWRVVADSDRDGSFSGADEVVSTAPALATTYRIYGKNAAAGADGQVTFLMNGALASTGFDMNVCFPGGDAAKSRRIRVRASGNVSSHKNTAGSSATTCPGS